MKFLVTNYSCLQNPWLGGTAHRSLFSLSSTEFVEPPPPNKIPGYATDSRGPALSWTFTEDRPESDDRYLLDEAGAGPASVLDWNPDAAIRVAVSMEFYRIAQDFRDHLFGFLLPTFCWCVAGGRDLLHPADVVLRRLRGTQRVACPTPVFYRVPRTCVFSLTLCHVDQQVLLPKQPVHFILFG